MSFEPVEFPSDNPELWRARAPRTSLAMLAAVAVAEFEAEVEPPISNAREIPPEPDFELDVEVIEFAEEDFAIVQNESMPPPPSPPDSFQLYVQTLIEVANAAGAPARVIEMLPSILGLARLDARTLDDETVAALVNANLLARSESGAIVRSDALVASAQAWRATLLGEEADFSACTTTLDEWSANLVAAVAGLPAQKESLRRELRRHGVAAFGLVVDAA